jgi:hypothetical protein
MTTFKTGLLVRVIDPQFESSAQNTYWRNRIALVRELHHDHAVLFSGRTTPAGALDPCPFRLSQLRPLRAHELYTD